MAAWFRSVLVAALLALCGPAQAQEPTNFQGLWWADPPGSQSGWGLNIAQQGGILFATLFFYSGGQPHWVVMPRMERLGAVRDGQGHFLHVTYTGESYSTTGPPFDSPSFDPNAVQRTPRGTWFMHFAADGTASIESAWFERVRITRQLFAAPVPQCAEGLPPGPAPNYSDLWWASPPGSESGWGVHLTQQADVLFATWFTYGRDGQPTWYVLSEGRRTASGAFSGTLYRTSGGGFPGVGWNNASVNRTPVGSATFTFTDRDNGTFAYGAQGVSAVKAITRQLFGSPRTVCR